MPKIITVPLTENFIDRLMAYLEEHYMRKGRDMSRLAIVFGGHRPSLFVKREIAKRCQRASISPRFFTIDEFMGYVVKQKENFTPVEDLNNCYLLYTLARQETPDILKGREEFDRFLPWTREILQFIDQLDLENIDDKALGNVQANAEIGYAVPDDINRLLQHIVKLRKAYHQTLETSNMYSRGWQYLRAAQLIDAVAFDQFDEIIFANFFYFNRSEEAVVQSLHKRGKAAFIFQGDQRRWPVLQRIAKLLQTPIEEGVEPTTPRFDLKIYAAFDGHSQVGMVRELLKKIEHPQKAVIMLPQPDSLIPLLSEMTGVVKDFNISMGYPLKRSSVYSLFTFIFQAQLSRKDGRYYARDYLKVLRHPLIKNLQLSSAATATRMLV
ncbi:MAG: hypothetical protein Q7S13_03850, partial [Candidatus Omnitrophota bacterium]|nr:hypothetical protein [Candidatus Omnitrophota bacterium]